MGVKCGEWGAREVENPELGPLELSKGRAGCSSGWHPCGLNRGTFPPPHYIGAALMIYGH